MISLIKNEFIKIFKKKTIYILFLIMLLAVVLNTVMYQFFSNQYDYYESDIEYLTSELKSIDKNTDKEYYAEIKAELEVNKLVQKYGSDSWQAFIANDRMTSLYYGLYFDDARDTFNYKKVIDSYLEYFNKDNWQTFVRSDIDNANKDLNELKSGFSNALTKEEKDDIYGEIERLELEIKMNNYRLKENVEYGNNYLNLAIKDYIDSTNEIASFKKDTNLSEEEKAELNSAKELQTRSKYILDTKDDINNSRTLRYSVMECLEYMIIFVVIIVVVVAGSIVSDEFSKGTVKSLLVRPYRRSKILLSKLIVSFMIILISLGLLYSFNFIVGGIVYGFDTISLPAVVYDYSKDTMLSISLFKYVGIIVLYNLPFLILCMMIAFMLSTVFNNTAIAIALTLLGYFASNIINFFAINYNITILKYFITLNWDISQFAFGAIPVFSSITSIWFSLGICLVYFIVMILLSFVVFNKRNIKNI